MKLRQLWLGGVAAGIWVLLNTELFTQQPAMALWVVLLILAAAFPALVWTLSSAVSIPLVPVYCLMHLAYYVAANFATAPLSESELDLRQEAVIVVIVFLLSAQLPYLLTLKTGFGIENRFAAFLATRTISAHQGTLTAWSLVAVWLAFQVLFALRILPDLGFLFHAADTVLTGVGSIAIFFFAFRLGQGRLSLLDRQLFVSSIALWCFFNLLTGYLVGCVIVLLSAVTGYTMGARRFPVVTALAMLAATGFLHAGKAEYREKYWAPGAELRRPDVFEAYSTWISASIDHVFGEKSESTKQEGIFDRTDFLATLEIAMYNTPENKPFMKGETYSYFLPLMVPRILWPDKPRGLVASDTLAIYYGLQTPEGAKTVSIGMGQIAEGWANFGWLGIIGAGLFIGVLLSMAERLSRNADPLDLRFAVAVCVLPLAFDLEHCLAQWLVVGVDLAIVSIPALWLISKRRIARPAGPMAQTV